VGTCPNVRLVEGTLVIEWPDPRPDHFQIDSSLFAAIISELNEHRAAALRAVNGVNVLRRIQRDEPVTAPAPAAR
jgi:hypothetical protein